MSIKLIVTSCGYAESNQVAKIFWFYEGGDSLKPKEAFRSLIKTLLKLYKDELIDPKTFNMADFQDWLFQLSSVVGSSNGITRSYSFEEGLWWPWGSIRDVVGIKPKQTLLVEEEFEVFAVNYIDNFIPEEEMKLEFFQDGSKFWEIKKVWE